MRALALSLIAMGFLTLGRPTPSIPQGASSITPPSGANKALQTRIVTCPLGWLPDDDVCVRLIRNESAPEVSSVSNAHLDKRGQWVRYEQIPRRPDRPAGYDAYRYPIPPGMPGGHAVISGYDLDQPNEQQRRGPTLSHVGHGGVDLPQKRGTPVAMIALEHEEGEPEVLFTGDLFGTTVITLHRLREGGRVREYIMLFGHLDRVVDGLRIGNHVASGAIIGLVGDTGSPELIHLHLEIRRVRESVDIHAKTGGALVTNEVTVVCDPRNVLPLN